MSVECYRYWKRLPDLQSLHVLCLWAHELQDAIEMTLKSTRVRPPWGLPLAAVLGLCYWQAELCGKCSEFSSPGNIFNRWKTVLWQLQRRDCKEQNAEARMVASSTVFSAALQGELRSITGINLRFTLMLGVAWFNNRALKFILHVRCKLISELRSHWRTRIRH